MWGRIPRETGTPVAIGEWGGRWKGAGASQARVRSRVASRMGSRACGAVAIGEKGGALAGRGCLAGACEGAPFSEACACAIACVRDRLRVGSFAFRIVCAWDRLRVGSFAFYDRMPWACTRTRPCRSGRLLPTRVATPRSKSSVKGIQWGASHAASALQAWQRSSLFKFFFTFFLPRRLGSAPSWRTSCIETCDTPIRADRLAESASHRSARAAWRDVVWRDAVWRERPPAAQRTYSPSWHRLLHGASHPIMAQPIAPSWRNQSSHHGANPAPTPSGRIAAEWPFIRHRAAPILIRAFHPGPLFTTVYSIFTPIFVRALFHPVPPFTTRSTPTRCRSAARQRHHKSRPNRNVPQILLRNIGA